MSGRCPCGGPTIAGLDGEAEAVHDQPHDPAVFCFQCRFYWGETA